MNLDEDILAVEDKDGFLAVAPDRAPHAAVRLRLGPDLYLDVAHARFTPQRIT
jgi:hypothetical protein